MRNVSSAFKQALANDNRRYFEYADFTLEDNTVLNLTNEHFWQGGFSWDDAVASGEFEVGSAIVNKATIVLNNIYEDFDEYDFFGATAILKIGLEINGVVEKVTIGKYTVVNQPKYNGSLITIELYDNMCKFDKPYSESTLIYPASLDTIVRDACTNCGVTLITTDFPNKSFSVLNRPDDDRLTFREVIAYAAQISGCYARCNYNGYLAFGWFDFDSLETAKTTDDVAGVHYIDSLYKNQFSTDDVVITGVKVSVDYDKEVQVTPSSGSTYTRTEFDTEEYMYGTDGYVVEIKNNKLIDYTQVQTVATYLGNRINGVSFRTASVTHGSDPSIEAGDVAVYIDRKNNRYGALISKTVFSSNGAQKSNSIAEEPVRNTSARYSAETKNYVKARQMLAQEKTERERVEDDLAERISNAGGLYETQVQQTGGGVITYLHNKPILAESDIQIMVSDVGVMVTANGTAQSPTWYGLTVDGQLIANILNTVGVNADWINTGQLVVATSSERLTQYFNTADGMTTLVSTRQDDTNNTTTGVSWFTYDSKTADPIYVNSNSRFNFGGTAPGTSSSTAGELNVCRRDGQLVKLYRQEGTVNGSNFLKYRYEGYTAYQTSMQTDEYKLTYELFLLADNTMVLNIIDLPTNTSYLGSSQIITSAGTTDLTLSKGYQYLLSAGSDGIWRQSAYSDPSEVFFADIDTGTVRISGSAVDGALSDALTQQYVFDRLTNGGTTQGLFLINGQIYINMSYLQTGTLKLGGANNVDGLMEVYNASGTQIGGWNKDGLSVLKGSITGANVIVGGYNNSAGTIKVNNDSNVTILNLDWRGQWFSNSAGTSDTYLQYTTSNSTEYFYIQASPRFWLACGSAYMYMENGDIKLTPQSGKKIYANRDLQIQSGSNLYTNNIRPTTSGSAVLVTGSFSVTGTKSREVDTDDYGKRLLYCYETPSPLFGDVGEGVISDDGKCYVMIDSIFAETVTLNQYQVMLQKYGQGDCWVSERNGSYFIVEGTPGMAFGWELKAKQSGFNQYRLEKSTDAVDMVNEIDYAEELINHIAEVKREREVA